MDPSCDKCESEDASLIHMFWTCPKLKTFWMDIFQPLSLILEYHMDPNPLVSIFGTNGEADARLTLSVSFASLVAKCAVLLRWTGLRRLMCYLSLEKICYSISNTTGKFYKVWRQFLKYFSSLRLLSKSSVFPRFFCCCWGFFGGGGFNLDRGTELLCGMGRG